MEELPVHDRGGWPNAGPIDRSEHQLDDWEYLAEGISGAAGASPACDWSAHWASRFCEALICCVNCRRLVSLYDDLTLWMTSSPTRLNSALTRLIGMRMYSSARAGDLHAAVKALEAAVALEPFNVPVLKDAGRIFRQAGLLAKAEKAFQDAVRWDPTAADARKAIDEIRAERAVRA